MIININWEIVASAFALTGIISTAAGYAIYRGLKAFRDTSIEERLDGGYKELYLMEKAKNDQLQPQIDALRKQVIELKNELDCLRTLICQHAADCKNRLVPDLINQ